MRISKSNEKKEPIKILSSDKKRLDDYKVNPSIPYWEVVKEIIDKTETDINNYKEVKSE